MDADLSAAVRLLSNILSRRGEKVKESELEQLALWARKKGKLSKPSLIFSSTEWKEIGELLWDASILGGKDGKTARELGGVWRKVLHTLQTVSAEKKAAAAAIQAFEGAGEEKTVIQSPPSQIQPPPSQKPARVKLFSFSDRPIRGLSAPVSPSPQDVLDHVTQAETLSPPMPRQSESEQEVARLPHSRGVVTGGDSGGAEGGDGQSQMTQHRGGPQGGTQGGDESDAAAREERSLPRRARAQSDPERGMRTPRLQAAAHSDTERSPSPAGGEQASRRLATTATPVQAAAETDMPARPDTPRPAGCPLPSDSDTDSETSNSPVTALVSCGKQETSHSPVTALVPRGRQQIQRRSQRAIASQHNQHPSEIHRVISKLARLSQHPDDQHSPPPSPVVSKNPIDERRIAAARTAIMAGDWNAAGALSCPVVIANNTAKWEPYDYKVLQKAKETVSTYGLRSEAAKNIIQYIFTADVLCPADCTSIATLLLSPSQLLIFEREWKRLAAEEASKHRQVGDPFYAVQPDMLTGHGAYISSTVQLTYPVAMHQLAQTLALRALLLVPDKKKSSPYSTIKQGANEPYAQFIDRLVSALKDATDLTPDVQEHLFRSLAFENANSRARTILATLPKECPVDEMLERATRAEQNSQNAAFMATMHDAVKQQGHIIAAALTKNKSRSKSSRRNKSICFRCGETGHLRQSCHKPVWCAKCNLNSHATEACRRSGNSKNSATRHRAKTQIDALTQKIQSTAF